MVKVVHLQNEYFHLRNTAVTCKGVFVVFKHFNH